MNVVIRLFGIAMLMGFLVACERQAATPEPTPTPVVLVVTATLAPPEPTPTPVVIVVTATPDPSTPTPKPTDTAEPTDTPKPTDTAEPTDTPTRTPTPLPTLPPNAGTVQNGGNMRAEPGGETILGQVCVDDVFTFLMVQGDWYAIKVDKTPSECVANRVQIGDKGWVHKSLLTAPRVAIITATPLPTPTPGPKTVTVNQTKRIGPIRNEDREEMFSTEITLEKIVWATESGYSTPKDGYIYAIVYIKIKNLGPDPQRAVYGSDFEVMTTSKSIIGNELFLDVTRNCRLELADLAPGGTIQGCIAFEVPEKGTHNLIFAPYQYNSLGEGRYLSFPLRH